YAVLITYVTVRGGLDRRYAIVARMFERELGWKPGDCFETGIRMTVEWYLTYQKWVSGVMDVSYRDWIVKQYEVSDA
ncbi:dTDP-glucose 4,6-dehydratase, partial [Pseudomonas syringae]